MKANCRFAVVLLQGLLSPLVLGCLFLGSVQADTSDNRETPSQQTVAGYLERVALTEHDLVLKARLDTGATLSSLNALNLERFEREGEEWVRFNVRDPKDEQDLLTLEHPVKRNIRVVQHSGKHQRRPVIELTLCVGQHQRRADVSLVDRSQFTYQLLVGRNHMRDALLVDPGKRYLLEPECAESVSHD